MSRLATRRHYTGAGREDGRVGRLVGVTGYMLRAPLSLEKMTYLPDAGMVMGCWAPRAAQRNQRAPPRDAKGLKSPARELTYHPVPDIA